MTGDDSFFDPVADILVAWQERRDRGESVTVDDLAREHPAYATQIRDRVAALSALVGELTSGAAAPSDAREKLPSLRIDRYVRFRPAGEGGMGIVYWALDTDLNREVAFKVIRPDVGGARSGAAPAEPLHLTPPGKGTPASSAFETLKRRFLQEAWVTAGLEHPGIVPVYELGQTPEGVPYYTMRFVRGSRTLAGAIEAVKGHGIEERIALLEPFLKVCDTIRYAHSKGVVHRDLKPDNVALGEFGEAVVLDWGLAKLQGAEDRTGEAWQTKVREMREATDLRTLASALGTPGYMSPEAALGRMDEVDGRSDVYSLGAILYQILVGRLPFTFESYGDLVRQLMSGSPPDPSSLDPSVPEDLSRICLQALAKNRDARQSSAGVLAADVRAWITRREADREAGSIVREVRSLLDGAREASASDRLRSLDRAGAALERLRAIRPEHADAAALAAEVDTLRRRGIEEREAAARRRTLRRAGAAALGVAAVAGIVVAVVLETRRRETEDARAETAAALVSEKAARDEAEAGRRRSRALAFAQASARHLATEPMAALRLAREGAALDPAESIDALRAAISASPERLHRDIPGGMSVAGYSAASGTFAIGAEDGSVAVFASDGSRIGSVAAGGAPVSALAVSPDGGTVAIGRLDGTGEVRTARGEPVAALPRHPEMLTALRISPDGSRVLAMDGGRWLPPRVPRVARLVTRDGRELASTTGAPPAGGGFTADGASAFVVLRDGTVVRWDADGREIARFRVADAEVEQARPSPSGDRVALLLTDASVRIVGSETGGVLATIASAGDNAGIELAFAPSGRFLVLNDWTNVRVFAADGAPCGTLDVPQAARSVSNVVRAMAISPDSSRVALATSDGAIRVWDVRSIAPAGAGESAREGAVLRGHASQVRFVGFARDSQGLVSFAGGEGFKVWDPAAGEASVLAGHGRAIQVASRPGAPVRGGARPSASPVFDARWSPDGARIVTASADGTARVWTADGAESAVLRGHADAVFTARWTPDGLRVVTASADGTVRVWTTDGREVARLDGEPGVSPCVALAPDGLRVATADARGGVLVRSTADPRRPLAAIPGSGRAVRSIEFSPDGSSIALGSTDYSLRIVDAAGGPRRVNIRGGHTGVVAFSPDGTWLVTARGVEEAAIVTSVGEDVAVLTGHRLWISDATFSSDGSRVATASFDGTARIWTMRGECVAVLSGHERSVTSVAFSPDGSLVATTGDDGTVRLWTAAGAAVAVLPGSGSRAFAVSFSPDGRRVLAASEDGTARTWFVRDEDVLALADRRITRDWTRDEVVRLRAFLGPAGELRAVAARIADDRFAEHVAVSDAAASVEADTTAGADLRRAVLADLRMRGDDPNALNSAAWAVVAKPGAPATVAARAVKLASRAVRLRPDMANFTGTLATAHMRAGDAVAALEWVKRTELLGDGSPLSVAYAESVRALALVALGRIDEAAAASGRATAGVASAGLSRVTAVSEAGALALEAANAVHSARTSRTR